MLKPLVGLPTRIIQLFSDSYFPTDLTLLLMFYGSYHLCNCSCLASIVCGFVQPSSPPYLIALISTLFLLNGGKSAVSLSSSSNLTFNNVFTPSVSSARFACWYLACKSFMSLLDMP